MITVLDNFYPNVTEIFSLAENSCSSNGCGTALRSDHLMFIDRNFHDLFRSVIMNTVQVSSNLDLITYFSKSEYNPNSIGSRIHIDGRNPTSKDMTIDQYNLVVCGQIFLSPCLDENAGISFYSSNNSWTKEEEFQMTLNKCYDITSKEELEKYHSNFSENQFVEYKQNRLVFWKAGTKYRPKITEKQGTKLVHNFYIQCG